MNLRLELTHETNSARLGGELPGCSQGVRACRPKGWSGLIIILSVE